MYDFRALIELFQKFHKNLNFFIQLFNFQAIRPKDKFFCLFPTLLDTLGLYNNTYYQNVASSYNNMKNHTVAMNNETYFNLPFNE